MTIANVSLFVVIVLSTIGFSLFDFRNLPFKEDKAPTDGTLNSFLK